MGSLEKGRSREALKVALKNLPVSLQGAVLRYVDYAEEALDEVFSRTQTKRTEELADRLLFAAGVRGLWSVVGGTCGAVGKSLRFMESFGITAIEFGGVLYSYDSPVYLQMRELYQNLQALLQDLGLSTIVGASDLDEILKVLRSEV